MPDVHPEDHGAIRPEVARLFRREALDQYQRGSVDEGHLLELEPAWMRWAYRLILVLFGAALLMSVLVQMDREATGIGVVRGGRLVAVVPARDRAELRAGLPLRFELSPGVLVVESVSPKIVGPPEARRLLGPDGAALWTSSDAAMRIEAALPAGEEYGDGVVGRVRVRLGRERVLFALIPALRRLHV